MSKKSNENLSCKMNYTPRKGKYKIPVDIATQSKAENYKPVAALFVCFLDIKFGTILPSPVEST